MNRKYLKRLIGLDNSVLIQRNKNFKSVERKKANYK